MAIGDAEKAFIEGMIAHHEAAIKMSEDYLKKSDTSTRPVSATRMATGIIQSQTYEIENMRRMMKEMQGGNRSADKAAAALRGYDY